MLGQYENLSNAEYHSAIGISKSQLDSIHVSPLNYWDEYINPDRDQHEEKKYFLIGSATHSLILEPDLFKQQYAIGFDKSDYPNTLDTLDSMKEELLKRNLKISGSKADLTERLLNDGFSEEGFLRYQQEKYISSHANKQLIPAADYHHMLKSLEATNNHHTAGHLIKDALIENSFFAEDEFGLIRKCRPDFITKNGQICCDLKSTTDVSAEGFGRSISKFRYHVQGAWYLDTLKLVLGDDAPTIFAFVAAQKGRPYDVSVQFLTEEQISLGRMIYQKDLIRLNACLQTGIWPGADAGNILEAKLPKWDFMNLDE